MVKKILKQYVTISFLLSLSESFFFATYVVFLFSKGMDLMQINLINGLFMASVFILEIPTGAFADLFGRRKSVLLGSVVFSLAMLIYYLSGSFWMFVLAEVVAAISVTLFSGALAAWAVDSLKYHGFNGELKNVFKKESQFSQLGITIGSVIGAYIGSVDIALPWLVSSIVTLLVGAYCWVKMKEDYFTQKKFRIGLKPMGRIAKDSVAYGWKNKAVMYIIAFGMITAFSSQAFNMQWQIVFKDTYGLEVSSLGWLFAGISLFIMLGNQMSTWFAKKVGKEKEAIILSQAITSVGMILAAAMLGFAPVLVGFFIHELGRGMMSPLRQAYMNRRIPSEKRATILSFESMMLKGGAGLGLLLSGYLAKYHSISLAWLVSGIVLAVSIPLFLKIKNGD